MSQEPCCNAKIRQGLKANNPDITAVYFDLSNIQNMNESKENRVIKTGQSIEVHYNHTMKSGEIREKSRKSFVTHTYCPFCGKKY